MNQHILMGDVVASSRQDPGLLRRQLKTLVAGCNRHLASQITSPYTITLGDEFQGVAATLSGAVAAIIYLEEERLKQRFPFQLHYIAHFGEIATPINPEIAYGMMGPGLTRARSLLSAKQRSRPRFHFDYGEAFFGPTLDDLFSVLNRIVGRWKLRDFPLIYDLITNPSNDEVGQLHDKDRSLIWKRRLALRVTEYGHLKCAITRLAAKCDDDFAADFARTNAAGTPRRKPREAQSKQ